MAKNQVQKGDVIDYVCAGTVLSGAVVTFRGMLGIALTNGAAGDTIAVAVEGVWELPKVPAAVFAQGEKLLWDISAGQFDDDAATPATGDIMGGAVAFRAGANAETTALVKLTPGNTTRTP